MGPRDIEIQGHMSGDPLNVAHICLGIDELTDFLPRRDIYIRKSYQNFSMGGTDASQPVEFTMTSRDPPMKLCIVYIHTYVV